VLSIQLWTMPLAGSGRGAFFCNRRIFSTNSSATSDLTSFIFRKVWASRSLTVVLEGWFRQSWIFPFRISRSPLSEPLPTSFIALMETAKACSRRSR